MKSMVSADSPLDDFFLYLRDLDTKYYPKPEAIQRVLQMILQRNVSSKDAMDLRTGARYLITNRPATTLREFAEGFDLLPGNAALSRDLMALADRPDWTVTRTLPSPTQTALEMLERLPPTTQFRVPLMQRIPSPTSTPQRIPSPTTQRIPTLPTAVPTLPLPTVQQRIPTLPSPNHMIPTLPSPNHMIPTLPTPTTAPQRIPTLPTAVPTLPLPTVQQRIPTLPTVQQRIPTLPTAVPTLPLPTVQQRIPTFPTPTLAIAPTTGMVKIGEFLTPDSLLLHFLGRMPEIDRKDNPDPVIIKEVLEILLGREVSDQNAKTLQTAADFIVDTKRFITLRQFADPFARYTGQMHIYRDLMNLPATAAPRPVPMPTVTPTMPPTVTPTHPQLNRDSPLTHFLDRIHEIDQKDHPDPRVIKEVLGILLGRDVPAEYTTSLKAAADYIVDNKRFITLRQFAEHFARYAGHINVYQHLVDLPVSPIPTTRIASPTLPRLTPTLIPQQTLHRIIPHSPPRITTLPRLPTIVPITTIPAYLSKIPVPAPVPTTRMASPPVAITRVASPPQIPRVASPPQIPRAASPPRIFPPQIPAPVEGSRLTREQFSTSQTPLSNFRFNRVIARINRDYGPDEDEILEAAISATGRRIPRRYARNLADMVEYLTDADPSITLQDFAYGFYKLGDDGIAQELLSLETI